MWVHLIEIVVAWVFLSMVLLVYLVTAKCSDLVPCLFGWHSFEGGIAYVKDPATGLTHMICGESHCMRCDLSQREFLRRPRLFKRRRRHVDYRA